MKKLLLFSLAAILVVSSPCGCGPGAARIPPAVHPAAATAAGATLQASFRARMEIGTDRQRFEGTLALAAPDRLYVEIAGPLGGVRAVLAASAGRVVVLLPGTREYVEEPAAPDTFEWLLGLPLQTPALIDLIRSGGADRGDEGGCGGDGCVRRVDLVPGPGGAARALIVRRQGDRVSASLEAAGAGPSGFRALDLRLADASPIDPSRLSGDFFTPAVPAGWSRLRPGGAPGSLLQTR